MMQSWMKLEQRMDLIYKLKRKYCDTVEDIIAFGQQARESWTASSSRRSGQSTCRLKSTDSMYWPGIRLRY